MPKIYLRSGQEWKPEEDAEVSIHAPEWVLHVLEKQIGPALKGLKFEIFSDKSKVPCYTITLEGNTLTLLELLMITRNESRNVTGVINFENYGIKKEAAPSPPADPGVQNAEPAKENKEEETSNLTPDLLYTLKDLARHCIIVGKDTTTHYGGYPRGSKLTEQTDPVYVCHLSGLQFQQPYNSGRLVLIAKEEEGALPKGRYDDVIFSHITGQEKASPADCAQDSKRYLSVTAYGKPYYFDTHAYKDIVAQDIVLCAMALNSEASRNNDLINFKFLKYGLGFFRGSIPINILENALLDGIQAGLEFLLQLQHSSRYSQIKCIELPFYQNNNPVIQQKLLSIRKLCAAYGIKCHFGQEHALRTTHKSLITATTTCSDPHTPPGNEMCHGSVDASIAENLKGKANRFSPVLNLDMSPYYSSSYYTGSFSPSEQQKNSGIKNPRWVNTFLEAYNRDLKKCCWSQSRLPAIRTVEEILTHSQNKTFFGFNNRTFNILRSLKVINEEGVYIYGDKRFKPQVQPRSFSA